jgi:transposase
MKTFIRIGIDLAKNFFQVHAIEREGAPPVTRKLSRGKVLGFFAQAAPAASGWKLVDPRITGRGRSGRWGTKWC